MKSFLISFLMITCGVINFVACTQDSRVLVSVYYESLCPDSMRFFTSQLFPVYTSPLKRYFNLTLIPYGKSTHQPNGTGDWDFDCHHGPNECYGNKVQSCSLKHLNQDSYMKYINCLMSTIMINKNDSYPTNKCGTETQLDVSAILACANSTEGSTLLAEQGDKTNSLQPSLSSVPTIVINENYNKKDQNNAVKSFRSVLCSYIKGELPPNCKNLPNTNSSNILKISIVAIILNAILYIF